MVGVFVTVGPISQLEIVLLSFPSPPARSVLKNIFPPFVPTVPVNEPRTVQFVITLFVAPLINLIVDVPLVVPEFVLEIIREFPLKFKPLNVTLSAPFKSINPLPEVFPERVRAAPPDGVISIDAQPPALSPNNPVSVVLPVIEIMMLLPACVNPLLLRVANTPLDAKLGAMPVPVNVVYIPSAKPPVEPVRVICALELLNVKAVNKKAIAANL